MSTVPEAHWKKVGESDNAVFYEITELVLGVVPAEDSSDTEATARASLAFQKAHWQRKGQRGAVVVFMDFVLNQDSGARAVYANETHDVPTTCYALVGETFFARAASAVFTGLAKPAVPTHIFASLEEAGAFIEEMQSARGGKL